MSEFFIKAGAITARVGIPRSKRVAQGFLTLKQQRMAKQGSVHSQNLYRKRRSPKPEVESESLCNGKTTQTGIRN